MESESFVAEGRLANLECLKRRILTSPTLIAPPSAISEAGHGSVSILVAYRSRRLPRRAAQLAAGWAASQLKAGQEPSSHGY